MTQFENKLSLGNAITIGVTLMAVGAAWAVTEARGKSVEVDIAATGAIVEGLEVRVRNLETSTAASDAKNDERFNAILSTLNRIDTRLERMEKVQ